MANQRRRGNDDVRDRLHEAILETLLDKVRSDPYPSTTHLDLIESMLREDDLEEYADALLDKVQNEAFPSLDHLMRLRALT